MEKLGNPSFGFEFISHEEIVNEFSNLKVRKVSQKTDIFVKVIEENIDIVSYFLYHHFNNCFSCPCFPTGMKYSEVTPIHNWQRKLSPNKHFANLSKLYESLKYI